MPVGNVILNPVTSGGTWTVAHVNPANASVNHNGIASGLSVAGTYQFIFAKYLFGYDGCHCET